MVKRGIAALFAFILAAVLPIQAPLAGWFGAGTAEAAGQDDTVYDYSSARAAYNPDAGEILQVKVKAWIPSGETGYSQILAERLDGSGNRLGEPTEIMTFEKNGPVQLEIAYDPANGRYLLIVASSETAGICSPGGGFVLCGMWLNENGSKLGQPFTINDEQDAYLVYNSALKLAYDTAKERFVLAYSIVPYSAGEEQLRAALIDPAGYVSGEATVDQTGYYYNFDMVYEESAGRFLVAWTSNSSGDKVLGKYVYIDPDNAQAPITADAAPWDTGGKSYYKVNLAHGSDRTVLLWSYENQLTVSEVTYGGGPGVSKVLLEMENLIVDNSALTYNPGSGQFAAVWLIYPGEGSYLPIIGGAHISGDLQQITMEYPVLGLYFGGSPDFRLTAHAAAKQELLIFQESDSSIMTAVFGTDVMPFMMVEAPKLLHHPGENAYFLLYSTWHITMDSGDFIMSERIEVDKIGADGNRENIAGIPVIPYIYRNSAADCCDSAGRFLVVWDEEDQSGNIRIMGQWLDAGGALAAPFSIDTGGVMPSVKYDPASGLFSVVYYKKGQSGQYQVTMRYEGAPEPGPAVALSEEMDVIPGESPNIALVYDPGAGKMAAVWYDGEHNLYVQYFGPDGSGPAFSEPYPVEPLNAITDTLYLGNEIRAVYDENDEVIRIFWRQIEEYQQGGYGYDIYVRSITAEDDDGGTWFGEPDHFEVPGDVHNLMIEPAYDAGEASVVLYWAQFTADNEIEILRYRVNDLFGQGGSGPQLLLKRPRGDVARIDLAVATHSVGGWSAVAYAFQGSFSNTILALGLIENISLSEVLRGLDGDPDSISVADIVKYIKMNPSLERSAVQGLLDLIDPVHDPLPQQ